MEPDQARADVERLLLWDPQPTDSFLIKQALEVGRISQLSHWDALIIAAAQRADCNSLLSEDLNDGQKFGTVKVINPFTNDPPAN